MRVIGMRMIGILSRSGIKVRIWQRSRGPRTTKCVGMAGGEGAQGV